MADIIQLLPDTIANQIAAGEVIQRPSSVVKELLENSVDAGSSEINLIVKDAGKTLIQIIDNGCGMSETDARMCLERHATSKIREANDLFSIRTMGFRGEAMASIASIAHLELKSKLTGSELGTKITVEAGEVVDQEPCQVKEGTSIAVKNLFFNIPARRKFLKSNAVEIRHIIDEFERVALAHPDIKMTFHHNDNELFHVERGSFRQRIVGLFGKKYNEKLAPIEQETNLVNISGFICKPEGAKKTRGEQFFFVNKRFIKSHYLNHAIQEAMKELLPQGYYPGYYIMLEVSPDFIDVNIHPTKTEIKFEDEKAIYSIINSSVKQSMGQYNISPTLDFEQESSFDVPPISPGTTIQMPQIKVNQSFNPFDEEKKKSTPSFRPSMTPQDKNNKENWESLYKSSTPTWNPSDFETEIEDEEEDDAEFDFGGKSETQNVPSNINTDKIDQSSEKLTIQLHTKYILSHIKSGFMVIHQSRAHERILYEQYIVALANNNGGSQQQLFPQTVEFNTVDAELIRELKPELQSTGFDIEDFGNNSFVIQGLPAYATDGNPKELLEGIIEHFKNNLIKLKLSKQEAFARSMARKTAIRQGKKLEQAEMTALIDELFACENPYTTPSGKNIIITLTLDELDKRFA